MKKTLLTIGAVALSAAAFGQGTIILDSSSSPEGVALGSSNPATTTTQWYSGSMNFEIYFAAESTTAASQVAAINADAGNGSAALALLAGDTDFTLESLASVAGGSVNAAGTTGTLTVSGGVIDNEIELPGVPTSTAGDWIIVGSAEYWVGLLGFNNFSSGGSYLAHPVGTASDDTAAWEAAGVNLDFDEPEPTTLALIGLGGLSMLVFRRRKA